MLRKIARNGVVVGMLSLASLLRVSRIFRTSAPEHRLSTLLLPPAAPGNLGDDAMVSAALEFLRKSGAKRLGVLALDKDSKWHDWQPEVEILDLSGTSWLWMKVRFLFAVIRFERFDCLGADIMDGYYGESGQRRITELASLAVATGARSTVLAFSFNESPSADSKRLLQRLPPDVRLCVRDPISYQRLAALLDRPVELVADLAFLLASGVSSEEVESVCGWIESERASSRLVLGVNLNHRLFVNSGAVPLSDVSRRLSRALVDLYEARHGLSMLFIPHDYRPYKQYPGDLEFAEALVRLLPHGMRSQTRIVGRCRASDIRAICGRLDFVVTGLMHLAIAALERTTPAACLSYQGKFEGLMKHLGVDGLIMDPESSLDNLKEHVLPLIDKRQELRGQIAERVPHIRVLAEANFM